MKYEVFASQLEAHVGRSPVRGGKAIKTDRTALNNLNQLLSCVKNIIGRKASPNGQRRNKHKTAHRHLRHRRPSAESSPRRHIETSPR